MDNYTVGITQVAAFVCPSERVSRIDPYTINNYRYNIGATICQTAFWADAFATLEPWRANCNAEIDGQRGGMFRERPTSVATVTDGTSNTAAFSERIRAT